MAKTYREVLEEWERAKAFGYEGSLKDYSQWQNELHETADYNEGLRDGWIPRASTYLDQALDWTGLPAEAEQLMGTIGGAFGYEDVGRRVGRSLPRSTINMAPMFIPGAGWIGAGAAGGLMGLNTYADTGSAPVALVSGATGALMPAAGRLGGNIAARMAGAQKYTGELAVNAFGKAAGTATSEIIPTTIGQRVAQYAGEQVGSNVPASLGAYYQEKKLNPDQPFSVENFLAETLISQIPFTAYDTVRQLNTPIATKAQAEALFKPKEQIQEAQASAPYTPPPSSVEATMARETILDNLNRVANDPNIPAEQKSAALLEAMTNLEGSAPKIDPARVAQPVNQLDVTIYGRADKIGDSYRVLVDDVESAAQLNIQPGETVFVNKGDVSYDAERNRMVFRTKVGDVKPAKYGLTEQDFGVKATTWDDGLQPELPVQPEPTLPGADEINAQADELGARIEAARARLTTPEVGALVEMGVPQETGLNLVRMGDISENGSYFALEDGFSTYSDSLATGVGRPYTLAADAKIADTRDAATAQALVQQTLLDPRLTPEERRRLTEESVEGGIHYMLFDELPMSNAAKELGYDAVRVVENDDLPGSASSLFVLNISKIKERPTQSTVPKLKETVLRYEQAQVREAELREELKVVPKSADEVLENIGNTPETKVLVDAAVQNGATPKQAIDEVRLQKATQELDAAKTEQNVQKSKVKRLTGAEREQAVAVGYDLIKMYTDAAGMYPDANAPEVGVGKIINKALKKEVNDPKYTERIAVAIYKWQLGHYRGDQSAKNLERVLNRVGGMAQRKGSRTVESYLVDGMRVYGTEEEIQKYIADNNLAGEGWRPESRGSGDAKRFFVGRRPQGDVSLDQTVGEGTATLADVITPVAPEVQIEKAPVSTETELLQTIDKIITDPDDFAENYLDREVSKEDVADVVEELTEVKNALAAKQQNGTPIPSELKHLMSKVVYSVMDYSRLHRSLTLDSFVPGDKELAQSVGLLDPSPEKFFRYIASRKDLLGPIADFVEAQLPHAKWDNLKLRLPFTPGWHPGGWSFINRDIPEINVPSFPTNENLTKFLSNAAHEFVHYNERLLSARNDEPAREYRKKKSEILNVLRNSPALPKKVRDLIAKSIREDHWSKLGTELEDEIIDSWAKALGKNKQYFEYVYAMQSPDELASVLLSNPTAINVALKTKVPKNMFQSALHWFSNALNRLFGGKPQNDNALVDLIASYDNYLTGGLLRRTYNGFDLIRSELLTRGVHPDALTSRLDTIDRIYARGELRDSIVGFVRERDQGAVLPTAAKGEVKQILRTALVSGEPKDVGRATMSLLVDELPLHQDLYRQMQQDVEIAETVLQNVKEGIIPGNVPEGVEARLAKSRAKLNAMKRALTKQANALEAWNATNGLTVEGWEQNIRDAFVGKRLFAPPDMPEVDTIRAKAGIERLEGGKTMNPLTRNFMLTQHVKELHPALKAGIQQVSWEQAESHYRATLLNGAAIHNPDMAGTGNSLDRRILDTVNRVKENVTLTEAVSDLIRWQNKEGGAKTLDLDAPFVRKTLSRFKPEDREAILTTIRSIKNRHHVWVNTILPSSYGRLNVANTATLIMGKEAGMLPETARQLSAEVYDGLAKLVDPQTAPIGMEQLRALSDKMQPETYTAALTHAQGLSLKLKNALDLLASRPGWVTEQRYGESKLVMANSAGDKMVTSGTLEKLRQARADYEKRGYQVVDLIEAEDSSNPRFGIREDLLQTLEDLESQNEVLIRQVLANDPNAMMKVLSLARNSTSLRASIAAAGPMPGPSRKFRAGREYINMIENSDQYYVRMNNYLRNKLTRAEVGLEMLHPEVEGNAEYRRYLQQHVDNFLAPDSPWARKVVEATYFAKLGFDVGQAVIESTQQLTTGLAELIAETGSVTDAFALSAKINKMLANAHLKKKWENKEHEQLADILQKYGHSGLASWGDIVDGNTQIVLDASRGRTSKIIDKIKTMGAKMSTLTARYNDQVIAHAAFELARNRGESFDQAVRTAIDVKQRSLYTAGKAGRSVGFWSIKSRPVPQLLGALQNYTLGWFGQMAANYVKGFGKNPPKGLTPEQRIGARKAFAYSLIAQAALAGGLGLPGVGQALALFSQVTGIDAKGWIRKSLGEMFDEDEEYGGVLTGLALRGVGAAGLPIDPSNRTNVSIPFIGTDAHEGMRMANFAGATASTIADFAEGVAAVLQGDKARMTKVLPNALKRPATLALGEGDIRDHRGALITKLGMYERAAMMLGLQPSRVSAARDTGEAVRKMNDRAAKEQARLTDKLASLVRAGKVEEAQQMLVELRLQDPDLDIQSLLQSIANRLSAQRREYDYRRDLNPAASLAGLGASVAPSEAARRQDMKEVFRAFGVPLKNNMRADAEAEAIDRLMEQNPFLTLREAREVLRGTVPARRRYNELRLPEYLKQNLGLAR